MFILYPSLNRSIFLVFTLKSCKIFHHCWRQIVYSTITFVFHHVKMLCFSSEIDIDINEISKQIFHKTKQKLHWEMKSGHTLLQQQQKYQQTGKYTKNIATHKKNILLHFQFQLLQCCIRSFWGDCTGNIV